MPATVAEEWLNSCSGCEISILNTGSALLELLPELNFVHIPALIDHKYFGQLGGGASMEIPEADVGIVSGSVRNQEHKHVLEEMRKKTKTLIALGSCASYGGIPSQANMFSREEIFEKVFRDSPSTDAAPDPDHPNVPKWLDSCKALDEVVKVDITIPGCPPHPEWIADAVTTLLKGGTSWHLAERSVCDTCPVIREKKSAGGPVKRCFENLAFNPGEIGRAHV